MEAPPRQERKVVTVLFADLVGFTSRAESLDPEDVVGILDPYHERLRGELERFGGTVEKFIGDAVMAVFGAPAAHEDGDARRAAAGGEGHRRRRRRQHRGAAPGGRPGRSRTAGASPTGHSARW